ncbi:hypothetical protein [Streptomyces sp. NPDC050145]|uniref:hypothetical protein n=1 Tax=Streptomyces sp. NPDC050145 TaxID=3365602 RepID=UPI0037898389
MARENPNPVAATEVAPRIEYRQFLLSVSSAPIEPPKGWAKSGRIAIACEGGLVLRTGGNDFYPTVRVEVWPGEPAALDTGWDVQEEAEALCDGTVHVRAWDHSPVGTPLEAGFTGPCNVRAYCRGREAAAALIGEELFYNGVEEWLLQLWPLDN